MKKQIRRLLCRAFCGDARAWRRLGLYFLKIWPDYDRRLARACLYRAMELGDEPAFFLYHRRFSAGRQILDDASYRELRREYAAEGNQKRRKQLRAYLKLGTGRQRHDL